MSDTALRTRPLLSHSPILWDVLIGLTMLLGSTTISLGLFFGGWMMIVAVLGLIGLCLTVYGSFIEPQRITLNKKSIQNDRFGGIRIAIMADMHVGPYKGKRYLDRVVKRLMREQPDLILLPGDFFFDHTSDIHDLDPLKELHAPCGVFAVLGNHDSGEHRYRTVWGNDIALSYGDRTADLANFFATVDIRLLRNESVIVHHHDQQICIGGVDDRWMPTHDLPKTIESMHIALPSILLSHNPDIIADPLTHAVDLIVCGHTHGGQIRLPLIGPLRPIPGELGTRFDQGLFSVSKKTTLIITHGIGEMLARARLFCPPEIVMLTMKKGE